MILEVSKGEHIAKVAERLVAAALKFGSAAEATFNDVRLVAYPGSSAGDLCRQYDGECRRGAERVGGVSADHLPASLRKLADQPHNAANRGTLEWGAAEVEQLGRDLASRTDAHKRTIRALIGSSAECDALRAEVDRLTRERDDALIALGRQTYTAPYRELVAWNNGAGPNPRDKTDAEWIAIGRLRLHAAGLDPAPAADPVVQGLVAAFGLLDETPATDPANPPPRLDLQRRRLTRCQADDDGYCDWTHCPQELDGEPKATGRHCPFDVEEGGP